MDKKTVSRELWNSAEMTYIRRLMLMNVFLGASTAACLLIAGEDLPREERTFTVIMTLTIVILPILLFCVFRTAGIFRKAESYIFQNVLLDRPTAGFLRDTICFKVRIKRSDGKEIGAMTHAIFQTRGYGLLMEDYVNKSIMVAYNEETEILTVIG